MHALAYPSDTDVPAHRSQGFGRIGHSEPNTLQIPRSVVALPRRGADATRSSSLALAAAARRQRALLWQRLFSNALRHLAALARRGAQLVRSRQRTLHDLDGPALRDLGLTRGEIASLEAELRGAAQPTRVWALQARRDLSC
jgi:uncharacterized protein YjiS (DUF1127 family)